MDCTGLVDLKENDQPAGGDANRVRPFLHAPRLSAVLPAAPTRVHRNGSLVARGTMDEADVSVKSFEHCRDSCELAPR